MSPEQQDAQPEGPLTAHRLESLGRLSRGAAHEFNNLLGVVLGYVELARMGMESDLPRARGYLDSALESLSRAGALSEQLLTLAQSGEPAPPHAHPGPVVEAARALLHACGGRKVQFEYTSAADAPGVGLSRGALLQLLVGLGMLAIRAASSDEETLQLHLRGDAETGGARIDIHGLDLAQERQHPAHRATVEALEALIEAAGGSVRTAPAGQTQIDLPASSGAGAGAPPVFPSE
jgi:signal transduction histidine kinase